MSDEVTLHFSHLLRFNSIEGVALGGERGVCVCVLVCVGVHVCVCVVTYHLLIHFLTYTLSFSDVGVLC